MSVRSGPCGVMFSRHADGELVACVLPPGHTCAHGFADDQGDRWLADRCVVALVHSAFARPRMWRNAVVVIDGPAARVTSRGDLSQWFAANDLPVLARECVNRTVRAGCVLAFVSADAPELAGAGLVVCELARHAQQNFGSAAAIPATGSTGEKR